MKKLLLLCLAALFLVTACSNDAKDDLAPYRNKTSAELFHNGEKMLAKHDWGQAVKYFEALDAIYPFGPNSRQGQLDIIYAYYKDGDDASAVAAADRFVHLHAQDKDVDYAYYMKGLVLYNQGLTWLQKEFGTDPAPRDLTNKKQAYLAFNELVHMFPHSQYAPDAALHMMYIRNLLARKELQIATFYMKREAYVAAINRANQVVVHYDRTPSVIPALALMVKAYRQLGLKQQANNTLAVLQHSYPNAKVLRKLGPPIS